MPIVATELWDGVTIDWEKQRVNESLRCQGPCKGVFPGRYMAEVDAKSGLCQVCEKTSFPPREKEKS